MRFLEGPQANMQQMNMPQMNQAAQQRVQDVRRLNVSTIATPFGCCDYFSNCADNIFSLYFNGALDLLDWLDFQVSDECHKEVDFISFIRPEQAAGVDTGGYMADPCDTPNGIDFGSCSLSVTDFGRYGRQGPVRDLFKPEKYCKTRPMRLLDGQPVLRESDWDNLFAMNQMLNDVRKALITGNTATPGQFDGLRRWVRTGYACSALDSYVVDWNGNPMAGGAGITINSVAAPAGFDIVDFLLDLFRNINQRISWSPLLSNQTRMAGDHIILLPSFMARCLLDFYTCWSVCPGAQYEEIVKDSREMRDFRLTLNGGMFGDGQISLDGVTIPLLQYDWEMINGPTLGDMYFLTSAVGAQRIFTGEHLDANIVMNELDDVEGNPGNFFTNDEGRVLGWVEIDAMCRQLNLVMRPRLWCLAPWMQIRFEDVQCNTPSGPLSPDPAETSFYPQDSFSTATC